MTSQCATKSIILHLQWNEDDGTSVTQTGNPLLTPLDSDRSDRAISPMPSFSPLSARQRPGSSLSRSTSYTTPIRRSSLASPLPPSTGGSGGPKARLSLNTHRPAIPMTPISPSARMGSPMLFGRAAVLTAPPKLVAVV